jgi:acyl-CoA synthetase (AMP-forming)/AMP-acid ligase II
MFEYAVDAVPEKLAVVQDDRRSSYAELEARVNRLAHHFASLKLATGSHIGIYGTNSIEWIEAMLAAFKVRLVPVNINYRYVEEELRYLFTNADLRAVVYNREYGPRIATVIDDCPELEHLVTIEDGSGVDQGALACARYDDVLQANDPERDFPPRSPDDIWIIYTGGTTGMPKGVMWRHEDIFFALAGGTHPFTLEKVPDPEHQARIAANNPGQLVFLISPPLMHGAAQVAAMMNLMQGNRLVIMARFGAAEAWRLIGREQINSTLITGDAMARPLIEALDELEAAGEELDLSRFLSLSSSAAVFSPTVKQRYVERFPSLVITDAIGSTESGNNGLLVVDKDHVGHKGGGPTVNPGRDTVVLDEETLTPIEPGAGVIGKVARGGNIPVGYYKDAQKTVETFITAADGKRYAMPGDFATLEADGTITLLGRGSVSINSGGEKIFPEEVEQVLKDHADVFDALVVGVTDERWGQKVAAIVQPREGRAPSLEQIDVHCRRSLAGYKVPRQLTLVDEIVRSPAGKPDYPWAKQVAEAANTG